MITEEDLAGAELAGMAPEQRFRFIEQLAAKRLASERDYEGSQIYDDYDYMSSVLEAARLFNIFELSEWEMPARTSDWRPNCQNSVQRQRAFRNASSSSNSRNRQTEPNTVALNAATKEQLRFHLGQVHAIIDKEAMPDWKKQGIYDAITALEREIDKARTQLAAVLDVVGKVLEVPEKYMGHLQKIVGIFQDAEQGRERKVQACSACRTQDRWSHRSAKSWLLRSPSRTPSKSRSTTRSSHYSSPVRA